MNCERFLDLIDDFADSALTRAERFKMEQHLATCGGCREEFGALQGLRDISAVAVDLPDRDLWPDIAAGIAAAGPPKYVPSSTLRAGRIDARPFHRAGAFRWYVRIAAVAILAAMIVLAAAYLHKRAQAPASSSSATRIGTAQPVAGPDVRPGENPAGYYGRANANGSPIIPAGNFEQACQCGPDKQTSDLIDKAWIVDENLPSQRAREIISERLYEIAGQNSDNFFLHRASIDARQFPIRAAYNLTQRYRMKLSGQPEDPVWTFLYAYSLFGKDTPEMIRLMRRLASDHREFPWPDLVLAEVYGLFGYKDEEQVRSHLTAFMRLCPNNPEPVRLLVALRNSDFLTDAIRRMRTNLGARTDIQSLLLYQHLWWLEAIRGAGAEDAVKTRQRIREDIKRLEALDGSLSGRLAEVIRGGYFDVGDLGTFRDLFEKDTSLNGRWGTVMTEMQEWNHANPVPSNDAPAEKRTAYWESRLRASESWIGKMPESPSLWVIKLEALAALANRSESEVLEAAANVLALERQGAETPELGSHLSWRSNVLKVATLLAKRGLLLDQIPDLISEGYSAAERNSLERATDLSANPQWTVLMRRFSAWLEADDAWHSLAAAYLHIGKPEKANSALDAVEAGLKEFRALCVQAQADASSEDSSIARLQRQSMVDELAKREKRLSTARDGIRRVLKR